MPADGTPRFSRLQRLQEAIERLAALNERMARIVELRVFGAMTVPECAERLGVTRRAVERDWAYARAWLKREFD